MAGETAANLAVNSDASVESTSKISGTSETSTTTSATGLNTTANPNTPGSTPTFNLGAGAKRRRLRRRQCLRQRDERSRSCAIRSASWPPFQAADEDGGQIRLRLSPPELGSMKIEIAVHGGTMTAHVETESSATRNMLLDNLPTFASGWRIRISKSTNSTST